jgi:hypothetical protein
MLGDVPTFGSRCGPFRPFFCIFAHQNIAPPSSNPAPPLQNHMFSLEKPGFEDDSGDSLARLTEMFVGSKAAHKTMISPGEAPAGMDMHG